MSYSLEYSQYNFIGLIILLIIFINIKSTNKKIKLDGKLFLTIIISTALIMILNIIMDILHEQSGTLIRKVYIGITTLYFVLNAIPYMAWSLYVDYYIHRSERRFKKIAPIVVIPGIISIILSILSVTNKKIFFIDENSLYIRGDLFWLNAFLYYFYFVATYIQIIVKRKSVKKSDYYSLLSFAVLPAVAGIFQIIDTSKAYLWLGISLSALIVFINIQNDRINKDYLTGLYNRRELDRYLRNCINEAKSDELIFMIMIDINDFKSINDTYGHIEGDQALKHTANILTDVFRSEDFISRYAGDEFVVIVKLNDISSSREVISRVKEKFKEFNERGITPYDISISLGYDVYNPEKEMDVDDFIMHIDKLMYEDKERKKNLQIDQLS